MTSARRFEILPAIDLRGGRVVRLRQGDFAREIAYSDAPVEVARQFAAAGARWVHVVDLDAAQSGKLANGTVIAAIVAAIGGKCRVEVAGGLRDEASVEAVLGSRVSRAIVGTKALRDPVFVGRLVAAHGDERIAVAIDVRDGRAIGEGWANEAPGIDPAEAISQLADVGVTTFEVTAVDRDGLLEGPDLDLCERLVSLGRGEIIASGGITTLDDLRAVRELGASGAIIGRALYEDRLTLEDALTLA
jgi:phosphoribosylformimino-5-aminoimidazole carboxamide ribotide isomerase